MHGKTDEELLSWLGGFMDGEGSFVIIKMSGNRLQPRVQVANTHYRTLDWLTETLTRLELPHYIGHKHGAYMGKDGYRRKPQWVLMAVGLKRTLKWCQALLPYLVTKREQCELLIEFSHSRLSHGTWKAPGDRRKALLPREAEIVDCVSNLNGNKRAALNRYKAQHSSDEPFTDRTPSVAN